MLRNFQILQKYLSELFTKKRFLIFRSLLANFKNLQNDGFWPHIYFVKWTRKSTFLLIFGAYLTRKIARNAQMFELDWIANDIFHLIWKCMPLNMELFVENGFCAHFLAQMTYCTTKILQIYCTFLSMYDVFSAYFSVDISKFVKNGKIYRDILRYSAIYQDISRYIAIYPELIYFDMSILRYITIYWSKIYPNFWYILINSDISPKNDIMFISIYHDG